MAEKRKNLTVSAHEQKMMREISETVQGITFDSSRRQAFTPRLPELRHLHIFRRSEIEYRAVPNIHGCYVLWICLSGTGQLLIDGAHIELNSGETVLVMPGQPHIRLPDARKRSVSWLLLRFESDDTGWFAPFRNTRSRLSPVSAEQLKLLLECYRNKENLLASAACGAALQLLLILLLSDRSTASDQLVHEYASGASDACIRELCELMMQMPPVKDPFRIVAARRNVTPEYLRILFHKKTGHTPRDFMNRQKLNLAQHLLANSDLSISEIALRCGFSGIYPFSRFFSRKCKLSPSAYRMGKELSD